MSKAMRIVLGVVAGLLAVAALCALFFLYLLPQVIRPAVRYREAVALSNAGKYEEAMAVFAALDGYKDSAAKINEIKPKYHRQLLSAANVGSTVFFGSYEQDNDASNGKEDIEWIVLAKDGNKVLVISKYALDSKQYDTSKADVTWETCSLRKWLNGPFLEAFHVEERNSIIDATVTADKNPSHGTSPGNDVSDTVFLLSIAEVNQYFSSDEARQCAPTDHAKAQGVWKSSRYSTDGRAACWWWLRSPGSLSDHAVLVRPHGSVEIDGRAVYNILGGVRSAMWIELG